MKKATTLLTFVLASLLSTSAFAYAKGLYLSAQPNESRMIEWIKEEGDSQYKIYLFVYDKKGNRDYVKRIVNRDEISLATEQEMNGHKVGRRALVLDADSKKYVHCQVNDIFENGTMYMFCDLLIEGVQHRRNYIGDSRNFIPEVGSTIEGVNKGDTMILNRDVGHLEKGTKVRVRFFFGDGQILIDRDENFVATYLKKGPLENLYSVLVNASDLSKQVKEVKGDAQQPEANPQTGG